MTQPKTTFVGGKSPFAKPAPKRKPKPRKENDVDLDQLQIVDEPYNPDRRVVSKYEEFFSSIKPGQAIKCRSEDTVRVKNSLQKWLDLRGKTGWLFVRYKKTDASDGMGRVWLLEKGTEV